VVSDSVPSLVDLDGDADLDAMVGDSFGRWSYYENRITNLAPVVESPFGLYIAGAATSPGFADPDGNGDLDALMGIQPGDLKYFENIGTATAPVFAPAAANPFGLLNVGLSVAPRMVDLGGDGDLDVVVGQHDGTLHYFENTAPPPVFGMRRSKRP
jgi:hypothetical protein